MCEVYWIFVLYSSSVGNKFPFSVRHAQTLSSLGYQMVISEYLDHESTQFRLSASELLLFVSVVLVLINTPSEIPNRDDILLTAHSLWQKKKKKLFQILFYCLKSLMCCNFPFLSDLNVYLLVGTSDAEILRSPLLKPQSWRMFSLKSTE